jgi:O-acetyl-ADP-ribose deacetylase (regulator of RNase III)
MIHEIIFFDINESNIKEYSKILLSYSNIKCKHIDFKDLIDSENISIIISPSNSYLSMTGGIDKVYADYFIGIEDTLRKKMISKKYATSSVKYKNTNYILPIGKTIIVETGNNKCPFLMSSPTMVTPKDINGTDNVYKCMTAIIQKIKLINIPIKIACPCLGTGVGNMSAKESALQIKQALNEI